MKRSIIKKILEKGNYRCRLCGMKSVKDVASVKGKLSPVCFRCYSKTPEGRREMDEAERQFFRKFTRIVAYKAYIRDKLKCKECRQKLSLEVARLGRKNYNGPYRLQNVTTLCPDCHGRKKVFSKEDVTISDDIEIIGVNEDNLEELVKKALYHGTLIEYDEGKRVFTEKSYKIWLEGTIVKKIEGKDEIKEVDDNIELGKVYIFGEPGSGRTKKAFSYLKKAQRLKLKENILSPFKRYIPFNTIYFIDEMSEECEFLLVDEIDMIDDKEKEKLIKIIKDEHERYYVIVGTDPESRFSEILTPVEMKSKEENEKKIFWNNTLPLWPAKNGHVLHPMSFKRIQKEFDGKWSLEEERQVKEIITNFLEAKKDEKGMIVVPVREIAENLGKEFYGTEEKKDIRYITMLFLEQMIQDNKISITGSSKISEGPPVNVYTFIEKGRK